MAVQFNYVAKRGWKPQNSDENYVITLLKIELDEKAIKESDLKNNERAVLVNDNFENLENILEDLKIEKVDAILALARGGVQPLFYLVSFVYQNNLWLNL